ncbi:MAG: transcriptional repressor NrdR [Clostridia bacterium]|nr:transcriptional repressor NrdR [Clostridia bacterium]
MKCPCCGSSDSRVLDSRPANEGASIKRRRECPSCGKRFTTYEIVDSVPIVVIKKDGSHEFFDERKLAGGIMRACQKRPVDANAIVAEIVAELNNSLVSEISTKEIGERVMEKLRARDEVSYVRFASVYREFKDVDTFLAELNSMIRSRSRRGRAGKESGEKA